MNFLYILAMAGLLPLFVSPVPVSPPPMSAAAENALWNPPLEDSDTIRINFSDQATPPPAGYLADYGLAYTVQSDYTYGWIDPATGAPLSLVGNGRNRPPTPDATTLLETLVHMQYGDTGGSDGEAQEGAWEIALPNGNYRVTVTGGDASNETRVGTTHVLNVEDLNVLYQPTTYGIVNQFTRTIIVEVTDGRLTLDALGGYNTKINTATIAPTAPEPEAFCSHPTPFNGATDVSTQGFQITAVVNVPAGYELDKNSLAGHVRFFEQTDAGLVEVPSNANDTGGGDAITLTPTAALKAATTYVFHIAGLEANRIGDPDDRITFQPFSSLLTTAAEDDTNPPATLDGVAFTQVYGDVLGPGTRDRFTSLVFGPDGKLYASTLSNVIKRWTVLADGTLTGLEELSLDLQPSPHPVTGVVSPDPRLIIGLAFDPASTAGNLIAYVSHNALTLSDGPEWDGKISRISGPNLATVEDIIEHLPRSKKDHLTNSLVFGPDSDLFFLQGSNTAGGEPDIQWGMRPERLLSASMLRIDRGKLPATLPLSVYTSSDITVINQAPASGLTLADGSYNPYSEDSPLTLYATGIRNAYDLVFHSNGWTYIPTNGTAGNNNNSPNLPASNIYITRDTSGIGIRRPNGTYYNDPGVPGVAGGETQKDWLFKTRGGSYHGHPNPYRGEFVLNHGGTPYSGLPGQLEASYRDVEKYPEDLLPDPNYREVAYDFGMNKSPNGAVEYQSDAFDGKLRGMLLVTRFSGQDDIIVLHPGNNSGDIIEAFQDIPGLQSLDDPLDIIEHLPTGNLYVAQYDRGGAGNQKIILMRVADPDTPAPQITATPTEAVFQATVGVAGAETDAVPVLISNTGPVNLHITSVLISGIFATQYNFTGPRDLTLAPAESQEYTINFTPNTDNSGLGHQTAELVFESDGNQGARFRVGLHGLKTSGYGGSHEPALQSVVDVLGITTDVGWSGLTVAGQESYLGDEVSAGLFEPAGTGPVTLTPVARYSTAESLPFGWYTNANGQVQGTEIATGESSLGASQTLYPELAAGSTSFTPPAGPFGFYVYSANSGEHTYSENQLNGPDHHRVRTYPVRDRHGVPVAGSFLICMDGEPNGDYQDYVFLASNVQPYIPQPQVLEFSPDSLDYAVSPWSGSISQNSLLFAPNGSTGDPLNLEASEPWVIVPASASVGDWVSITVDPPGLTEGTYLATVTATGAGYNSTQLQLAATVSENVDFSAAINFQDNTFTPPAGYRADVGLAYGNRDGLTYGWINPYTKAPQDHTAGARGADRQVSEGSSDQDKLMRSFNMLDWGKQNPPVPRDWEIAVPNGVYLIELAVGDPSYIDSRHTIRAEGVVVVDDFVPSHTNYSKTGSAHVEVTDGRLTIDDNGAQGIGNSKLIYISIQQVDPGTATGALVRIENLTKTPFNNRSFPSDDFFTFHRMDHSFSYHGNELFTHEENYFRIHNDGTAPLVITNLTTTDTRHFTISEVSIPPGGLTVNPGGYVDAKVTFVSTGLPGPQLVTEKLVLESNADNGLTTHITFRGAFMRLPEGGNEITTQQSFDALGFITEVGRDANGHVIDRPGSDYPTDEEVNNGALGDMVLSRFWAQADPNTPIRVYQLAALHGPGYAPTEIRDANRHPVDGFVFRHGEAYHQAFLPRLTDTSPQIAGRAIDQITIPFQVMIAGYSTAGGSFDGSLSNEILGCRAFKAIDRDGKVLPNEFILIQDYIENGCGPGTANCDFQDNIVYITNVRPVDLPSAQNIPDFVVASNTPTDYGISGYFDRGYAGNRLLYSATLTNGTPLPGWMSLEGEYGTFTFHAPDAAVGQAFDIMVTATDDNLRAVNSNFRLTVTQGNGEPVNQPPQAVAAASPNSGTAPLLVTFNGGGSSDPENEALTYQWSWSGGSASGVSPQVSFPAGSYAVTLTVTDPEGAQDSDVVNIAVSPPSSGDRISSFWLEAECAQIGSNWSSEPDGFASNGSYVVYPAGNAMDTPPADVAENRIRFTLFDVEAGNYHLFARIQASDGGNDSYWVRINSGDWIKWNSGITQGSSYHWNHLPGALPFLLDGLNTIDIAFREDGTKLDKIHLDKDAANPSDLGGSASNCGGTPDNNPPAAVASANPDSGTAPLTVALDGSQSTDTDGTITSYEWTWNGGSTSGPTPSVTFAAGTYVVTLTVTDNEGAQGTDEVTVIASTPTGNVPPTAVASASPNSGTAPLNVLLDGTLSTDDDGTIDSYAWTWNGGSAAGSQASVTFNTGTYAVTLTVTDNEGAQATDVVTVTASGPPPPPGSTSAWLEAECGLVGSNWITQTSTAASGGSFTEPALGGAMNAPPDDLPENRIRFVVSNLEGGSYHLFARIGAPDGGRDSYWVRVNGGDWYKWFSGMVRGSGFSWNRYPPGPVPLIDGTNTIDFAYREAGTMLDKIHLDQDPGLPSGDGATATNCNPTDDADGDGVTDTEDNCPNYYNPDQSQPTFYADFDGDGYGDPSDSIIACPTPSEYVTNNLDNCPSVYSTNLADTDGDGIGDACDPDTPTPEVYSLEAECASVGGGWQTRNSAQASGGQYLVFFGNSHQATPKTSDPYQEVSFTVQNVPAGNYHLYLRLKAPDNGRNSFWVKVDDGEWIKMWKEIGGAQLMTSGFEWRKVNHDGTDVSLDLTTGDHLITVANREAGTELDKLILSPDPLLPVGNGQAATNCPAPAPAATARQPLADGPEAIGEDELALFPNPTSTTLNIRWRNKTRGKATLVVSDLSGRRLLTQPLRKETDELQYRLETDHLPPGTYRITIVTAGANPRTALFVRL